MGRSYAKIKCITGKLNSGAIVTLFNNQVLKNHSQMFHSQQLCFKSDYMIWSNDVKTNAKFNSLTCILRNAFLWSGMSCYERTEDGIKPVNQVEEKSFSWFGTTVTFSIYTNNLFLEMNDEETRIIQRLVMKIESTEKRSVEEFLEIQGKIIALISFAIKNNVNIEGQYLEDFDESHVIKKDVTQYYKHRIMTGHRQLEEYDRKVWEYNFQLNEIPLDRDINEELEKLVPVINLYLSLFKYRDMPLEMIFLNIIQALETYHSRFYYEDKKDKYVKSVMNRFEESTIYEKIKPLLLSDTQMDEHCNYIILVSRLNDLMIDDNNPLFYEYWAERDNYAQVIADTRHYYTHYGKAKEAKALKGEDLKDAICTMSWLLEYHICASLGIDISRKIGQEMNTYDAWKRLERTQCCENTTCSNY